MAWAISRETAERIRELIDADPTADDATIARRMQISQLHIRRVRRGEAQIDPHAEVMFRAVPAYFCPHCRCRITVRPCPKCAAEKWMADRKSASVAVESVSSQ